MTDHSSLTTQEKKLETEVRDMHLKEEDRDADMDAGSEAILKQEERSTPQSAAEGTPMSIEQPSRSPNELQEGTQSATPKSENADLVGGDVTLKQEPGKPPKLARTTARKVERRPPPMFNDYKDSTAEATSSFQVITECSYANKGLGTTDSALECDCAEEWGKSPFIITPGVAPTKPADKWHRSHNSKQQCLWRGLRLHQPRHQDGVRAGLRLHFRLPKPALLGQKIRQSLCYQNREKGIWPSCRY
jgi:hypothetical protein